MHRIALDRKIPHLLENVDPLDNLVEYVLQYNSLSALASVLPPSLYAFLFRLFSECVQGCEGFEFVRGTKVYMAPIPVIQLSCGECPEIGTANNQYGVG